MDFTQVLRSGIMALLILPGLGWARAAHNESTPSAVPSGSDSIQVVLFKEGVQFAYPRWSNDGKRVLYQSNETGTWQICVMNADGTSIQRITHDTSNNNYPDWSPDNRMVAFVSDRTGDEDVYVMNMDGSGLRNLSKHPNRDIHPYWSPDGRSILFNSNRDDLSSLSVFRTNIDGTGFARISGSSDPETCARFSPDASRIVSLRADQRFNDEVFITEADGSNPINLTKSDAAEGWPVWTPDGRRVVFSSDPSGNFRLYMVNGDGTDLREISHAPAPWYDARPSVSPDGKQIVFNRQRDESIAIVIMPLE